MNEAEFHSLAVFVSLELENFDRQLRKLHASHYPSEVARQLIERLLKEVESGNSAVEQIRVDFAFDPMAGKRLQSEHRKLVPLQLSLEDIRNAQTRRVPWSLVPTIESIGSAIIPGKRLLTTCTSEFNYGIKWYPNSSALSDFAVLTLPSIHKSNAMLHVVVGHEFFHPILNDFFLAKTPEVGVKLREACAKLSTGGLGGLFGKSRLDQLVEFTRIAWMRALEEIMCDMGCFALFGPASLFAISGYALTTNWDELPSPEGNFYPPWRYRLRAVVKQSLDSERDAFTEIDDTLNRESFEVTRKALHQSIDALRAEVVKTDDIDQINKDPFLAIAYAQVSESLADAWSFVKEKAEPLDDRWDKHVSEIPFHLRSLQRLVPPSEVRNSTDAMARPSARSAVVLATWLHRISDVDSAGVMGEEVRAFRRMCRLMLKALEDIELREHFSKLSGDIADGSAGA